MSPRWLPFSSRGNTNVDESEERNKKLKELENVVSKLKNPDTRTGKSSTKRTKFPKISVCAYRYATSPKKKLPKAAKAGVLQSVAPLSALVLVTAEALPPEPVSDGMEEPIATPSVLVISADMLDPNASVKESKNEVARLIAEETPLLSVIPISEPKDERTESMLFAETKELATLRPEETMAFISFLATYELATLRADEAMELRSCPREALTKVKMTITTMAFIAIKSR